MLLERVAFFFSAKSKRKRLMVAIVLLINEHQHVNLSLMKSILFAGGTLSLKGISLVSRRLKRIYPFQIRR
jgi:hypothetical protein